MDAASTSMGKTSDTVSGVVGALCTVLGTPSTAIELHEPMLEGNERSYLEECVATGWVSSGGPFVKRFETMLAETLDVPDVVAVSSGTAALHAAFPVLGVKPGEEVLTPSLNFVAAASVIRTIGAVPHFIDCDAATLAIDPVRLGDYLARIGKRQGERLVNRETGRTIVALICLHPFGHAAPMPELLEVAGAFGLPLIEDAAEALGSRLDGRALGTFGRAGILSFNGNKIVTTGGGGAIVFADPSEAARARHLTTTAKAPHPFEFVHDAVGFNYRMPNVNAALGCAQLERLPFFLDRKRKLAERYDAILSGVSGIHFLREPKGCISNYWLCTILLDDTTLRDPLLHEARAAGFNLRPVWRPMHLLPPYADCPRMDLSVTEDVAGRAINLPSSANL